MKHNKTQSSMFKVVLSVTFLIVFFCTTQTITASCFVCLHNGECGEISASCMFANLCPCVVSCEDCTIAYFNPKTDYIVQLGNGEAYILKGNKKIQILGDACESFLRAMQKKYTKEQIADKQIQKRLDAEFAAFSKTDNHKVSSNLIALISKESGLKIRKK